MAKRKTKREIETQLAASKQELASAQLDLLKVQTEALTELNRTRLGCSNETWALIGTTAARILKDKKSPVGAKLGAMGMVVEQRKVEVAAQKSLLDTITDRLQGRNDKQPQAVPDDELAAGVSGLLTHIESNGHNGSGSVIALDAAAARAAAEGNGRRPRRTILGSTVVSDGEAGPVAAQGTG